jgi:phage/plasmid-associated DNA primase
VVAGASLMMTAKPGGGPSPEIAKLFGRRLVTINETQQDERLNESRVKFITSHDTITARDMYEKPFDFPPTHKTVMTTNHKPIVRGTDEGIWRRIHLWPFLVRIENVDRIDRYFRERVLIPELPGILNWALAGTAEYFKDGLNPPQAVTGATKKYRSDMDVLGRWVDEQCWQGDGEHCWLGDRPVDPKKVINGVPVWTSGAKLLESYLRWSGSKMSSVGFGRKMTERRYRVDKWGGERGVYGLVLKPQGGTRYGDPASGMGDTEKPGNEYEEVPF